MCRHRSGWTRCDQNINWIGYKCAPLHADVRSHLSGSSIIQLSVACENIRFSSLFAAGDVSRGGRRRHEKFGQIYIWNRMTNRFIMWTLICVISMEFLQLSCRRSSARNVQGGEERGETNVFAGWAFGCWHRVFFFLRAEPPRRGHHRGCPLNPSEHSANSCN